MEVKSPSHGAARGTLTSPTCSCHFTAPCNPRYLFAVTWHSCASRMFAAT
jgi:hypothetical protein